jgi:hypothetical protein
MANDRYSPEAHPLSKPEILQSASEELARYDREKKAGAAHRQTDFNPITVLLTILFFILVCILIAVLTPRTPQYTPANHPTSQQ